MTLRVQRQALALLAASALMTGCGTLTADPNQAAAEPAGPTPTHPVAPAAPSDEPSPAAEPTPVETQVEARPTTLRDRLLPAARLPGFNTRFTWRTGSTTDGEGADLSGTCHKFELTSIGASKVATRTYVPAVPSPSSARAVVVEFPDTRTAKRAYAVLGSWRDQCQGDRQVGDFQPVELGTATGGWYLLTSGTTFEAQGFARRSARIVVLTMTTQGQDYNYPAGKEPMVAALKRAVALL